MRSAKIQASLRIEHAGISVARQADLARSIATSTLRRNRRGRQAAPRSAIFTAGNRQYKSLVPGGAPHE